MRPLLWCSPLPPTRSGVSDYAVELLAELGLRCRVRVVCPPGIEIDHAVVDRLPVSVVQAGTRPTADEVVVAHLGNNPYHSWVVPYLGCPSVLAVVHDLVLHHLLVEQVAEDGGSKALAEALGGCHGDAGRALAAARGVGRTGRLDPFLFAARRAFLNDVDAVMTHSDWGRREILADLPNARVVSVNLPVDDPQPVAREELRRRLGIGPDEIALMHLGFLTREKGMMPVLEAVAARRRMGFPVRLILVGEGRAQGEFEDAARKMGLGDAVIWTGWVDHDTMRALPVAADLGVALRDPSAGETSAAALRFIAAGCPVAVVGRRQFLELPESAAPRITPGPSAAADIIRLMELIPERRWQNRRAAARATYEDGHTPRVVADQWEKFLEDDFSVTESA